MIPIGDSTYRRDTPWVNYAIIVVNFAVFLYMLGLSTDLAPGARQQQSDFIEQTRGDCYGFRTLPTEADRFICQFGFQPREWFDTVQGESTNPDANTLLVLLTVVTAVFLHGGWLHILGNMVFLWVFGDNIEDRLGSIRYLLFYLASGIVASLVQGAINPDSVVPTVGASGAVAGVLGAYLVCFPGATVTVVFPVFFVLIPLPIPAILMIGFWFLQNLFAGYATITAAAGADEGVAWFAHIGGFLFGMAIALIAFPAARRRPPPGWP